MYSWGAGASGELGTGILENRACPAETVSASQSRVVHVQLGGSHSCAVNGDNS